MRKGLVLPHCTNLRLRLDNLIISWESRCFSGQEVQRGGSHGLILTMMPGKSSITFHFYGSIVEQEGRRKTVHVCLGLSKRHSLNQIKTGWVIDHYPFQVSITQGPDQKWDQTT